MTKVTVTQSNDIITSLTLDGHTHYGVEGEDIVCAGLSCVSQTAVLGIFAIAKVNAVVERDEKRGYLSITLPKNLSKEELHDAQVILKTALLGISDLREGYSDFIELEVKHDVY